MPRIAIQLSEELVGTVCEMVGSDNNDPFDGSPYAIVTMVSATEFNFKLTTEDEIFEAVKNDAELQVISLM